MLSAFCEFTMARQPRWSEPTEYKLSPEIVSPVWGPAVLLLMSSSPAVMFPLPSAVKLPARMTPPGAPAPPPPSRNAYCPLSAASFPDGQAIASEWFTVTATDADFEGLATAVAVKLTINVAGTKSGGV